MSPARSAGSTSPPQIGRARKAFYGALFGWEAGDVPGGHGTTYTRARLGGEHVAGIYELPPPRWTSYVCVEDADATVARARELGGTVKAEPFDVGGGRRTEITDPAGAVVAIWEPGDHIGAGRVNEVGCLCWNELTVPDFAAVERFYADLFEWQVVRVPTPEGAPEIATIANRGRMAQRQHARRIRSAGRLDALLRGRVVRGGRGARDRAGRPDPVRPDRHPVGEDGRARRPAGRRVRPRRRRDGSLGDLKGPARSDTAQYRR